MNKRCSRFTPSLSLANAALESRVVLSGNVVHHGAAEIAAQVVKKAATETSLAISAGTLGQPITFTATVRSSAAAGPPQGTVEILDHGKVIQTLTLSPSTSSAARSAISEATATLVAQPGGGAYYFGRHALTAEFIPSGPYGRSSAAKSFTVTQPSYTTLAGTGGVKIATIAPGSGPAIQAGQTANMLYTGYLESNGKIFDDSINDGGSPFSFTVGAGQVIPGFDSGTVGMQAGETRIIDIPAAEGYGSTATGSIPANSNLIFVLTLESIS